MSQNTAETRITWLLQADFQRDSVFYDNVPFEKPTGSLKWPIWIACHIHLINLDSLQFDRINAAAIMSVW
jgi:hypothetical protein